MHLLAAQPGGIADGSQAVDLGQSPGDIVFLSAADTELAALAAARHALPDDFPTVRLANLMNLTHPFSVDTYVDDVIAQAKVVVIRLLGGVSYWDYGVEQVCQCCRDQGIKLAFLPGDDQPDPQLATVSTLGAEASHRLWQYCVQGGPDNAVNLLNYAATLMDHDADWREPAPLLRAGIYWPGLAQPDLEALREEWLEGAPVATLIFYRALVQGANLAPVDALVEALRDQGINALPLYVTSLKDQVAADTLRQLFLETAPQVVLNLTGFALSKPNQATAKTPFDDLDCPILQVVLAGTTEELWQEQPNGLSARDIAMNVALPEVDGRVLSRAISFKAEDTFDALTEVSLVKHKPVPNRCAFVARLTKNWITLRQTAAAEKKIALVLANYPNRDGRLGNGVGLDSPAAAVEILQALQDQGYDVPEVPASGNDLVNALLEGATNALKGRDQRLVRETLSLEAYRQFFDGLPQGVKDTVTAQWGTPETDPFVAEGHFVLPALRIGKTCVAVQPARGYNIDPVKTYHDPDLVPPHGYLAFYAWLRLEYGAHAVIHVGKHGNLEWLPGKSLALSEDCFPEVAFDALPHLYPFIINDPGEGTQAKRRAAAVILDHLTPPLTRAESYGPLRDLEALCDEYYEAAGVDPRRLTVLKKQILEAMQFTGLAKDMGLSTETDDDEALNKLDAYLCELKELQIRDGLHIFGQSPQDQQLHDLLVALIRLPRGPEAKDQSILRALADDLNLDEDFDPLDCQMAEPWQGAKPDALQAISDEPWRSKGDTVERLELLALQLVSGPHDREDWPATAAVLAELNGTIRPNVECCGASEIQGLLKGLNGEFVQPGPSGAPTRGRPEVLPTGRNFYSVDTRTVPTPAASMLGWKAAQTLVQHYVQQNGEYPETLAISAWGTSNMRTGGDDIAQALALIGCRPTWEPASGRVTGFEILPVHMLDRPRVDVTLRISGFFRDAFPGLIDLFDSAVRAVAQLDEPPEDNPLAAKYKAELAEMKTKGLDDKTAEHRAGYRVFGSKPGAYGAGLQALIDEKGWETEDDLARAYVAWGGYAYGAGAEGQAEHGLFEQRLSKVQVVLQNQDNREHDILDSDDYYQFEGGITAAVRSLSGSQPTVYHGDTSRPEKPVIRTLEEEISRVVRSRVVNPKWIEGVMRHGYKGAFEMAATVDYLFAFAATAKAVQNHHFDLVYDAYIADETVLDFLKENNPHALREMADRLLEAQDRNLWNARSNSARYTLEELSKR